MQNAQNFIGEINIQLINICNLKCNFCPRSNISALELKNIESTGIMSLDNFKEIVDRCVNAGITKFSLTPRMGEVLIDKGLFQKLQYLEDCTKVQEYFFATNLTLEASKLIKYLNTSKKCTLEVSYYGDINSFKKLTNGSEANFKMFINNLTRIAASLQKKEKLTIFKRFTGEIKMPIIQMLKSQGIIFNTSEMKNFNIGGLLKNDVDVYSEITRNGECPTKQTGSILINGDYNLCYMNDVFNTMSQGNILKTDLRTLRNEAELDGHECCRLCNECW